MFVKCLLYHVGCPLVDLDSRLGFIGGCLYPPYVDICVRVVIQTKISGSGVKSKSLENPVNGSSVREPIPNPDTPETYPKRSGVPVIVPPPPPPVLQPPPKGSPSPLLKTPSMAKPSALVSASASTASDAAPVSNDVADDLDEDFGDFQAA